MIIIVTVRLDVVPMKNDEKTRRRKKADLCVFLSVFFFFCDHCKSNCGCVVNGVSACVFVCLRKWR